MNSQRDSNDQDEQKSRKRSMDNRFDTSFFEGLFDFSFDTFITRKLIQVLYVLAMIGAVLGGIMMLGSALATGEPGAIILSFFLAPFFTVVSVVYSRVLLELLIVIFSIAEDVSEIRQRNGGG